MYSKRRADWLKKIASLISIGLMLLAWVAGGVRIADNQQEMVNQLLIEGDSLKEIHTTLFLGAADAQVSPVEFIGLGSGVGYGGRTEVGLTVSPQGEIQRLAVISSKDTSSYLDKVLQSGLMESVLGKNVEEPLHIDAVSGATVSSNALSQAVELAADSVRIELFGFSLVEDKPAMAHFRWLDGMAIVMFVMAVWVNKSRHRKKFLFNWVLLLTSMCLFGFFSSSLVSSSTMGILISGTWMTGLGSYTSLILLSLVLLYIIVSNRNVYCSTLCPFGATQECLAKLGNAKTTSLNHPFFEWFPRMLLLTTLCLGLYFRNPASFSYEPFGIMFGMIGSLYLFVLTAATVITSLVVKRPWCRTICPMNPVTDFVRFNRQWIKSISNRRRGKRN
ncbi:4Fe-4S binding protein [uncultured Shewanella sp.]|uniref:FMN-binding protein n=1 Tax=uncultured Shewanella sp. TaxID=173975 RepID=UPI00262E1393|nr:4Fe-4S binding protein [uncultured Shewanella sp.]